MGKLLSEKTQPSGSLEHNSNIDILRIIACLFVITIHIMSGDIVDSVINKQALLVHCIVGDAVAIFFSITGYLWFRYDKPFKKIICDFIKKIAIPTIIAGLFSQILIEWIKVGTWSCSLDLLSPPNLLSILDGIIQHEPSIWNNLSNIYWYVFDYAIICLWFPVIKAIIKSKNGNRLIFLILLWMFFTLLIENTLSFLKIIGINYTIYTYRPISVQLLMVLLGYIMSCYVHTISANIPVSVCVVFYVLTIYARFLLQYKMYQYDTSKNVFVRYDCSISILTVISMYLLIWKFNVLKNKRIINAIKFISRQTFCIYLIHFMIIRKFRAVRILKTIEITINQTAPQYSVILYDIVSVMLVFCVSFCVSIILSFICRKAIKYLKMIMYCIRQHVKKMAI